MLYFAMILFCSDKYFPALGFGARIPPGNEVNVITLLKHATLWYDPIIHIAST